MGNWLSLVKSDEVVNALKICSQSYLFIITWKHHIKIRKYFFCNCFYCSSGSFLSLFNKFLLYNICPECISDLSLVIFKNKYCSIDKSPILRDCNSSNASLQCYKYRSFFSKYTHWLSKFTNLLFSIRYQFHIICHICYLNKRHRIFTVIPFRFTIWLRE